MNSPMLTLIPPILRGLTFDGEKGAIIASETGTERAVREHDCRNQNEVLLLELTDGMDEDALLSDVKGRYEKHRAAHGQVPSIFILKGKAVFAAGPSWDSAQTALNTFLDTGGVQQPRGEEPQRTGRNRVVDGKVCVVTGGAQGFGAEISRELVSMGALVFIADLNSDGAALFAEGLNKTAGRTAAVPVEVNVTDEESVKTMVDRVVRSAGGLDLLVSNAGVLKAGSVKELSLKDFSFVTSVNYIGYFLCTKFASPVMALQNRAASGYFTDIIQINSKSGLEGSNKNGAYAGGKFGGIGLTQSFAKELVEDNIKVNSICPGNFFEGPLWSDPEKGLFVQYLKAGKVPGAQSLGDVKTFYENKVPMKRGCTGRDVAQAMYYIIDQKYETGQAVPVTGGQVMLK